MAAEDGLDFAPARPKSTTVELIDYASWLEITLAQRGSRQPVLLVLQAQRLTRPGIDFAIAL